jgi:hypothetical protein
LRSGETRTQNPAVRKRLAFGFSLVLTWSGEKRLAETRLYSVSDVTKTLAAHGERLTARVTRPA